MAWFWRRRRLYRVVWASAEPPERLTSWERGNVTAAHRELIERIPHGSTATWSQQALWACADRLSTSTITEASHICIEQGWTDGDAAFCVVYRALHDPLMLIGVRREKAEAKQTGYRVGGLYEGAELEMPVEEPDPAAFGRTVAEFDIGEPLGAVAAVLVTDGHGVAWYGSIDPAALPCPPGPATRS